MHRWSWSLGLASLAGPQEEHLFRIAFGRHLKRAFCLEQAGFLYSILLGLCSAQDVASFPFELVFFIVAL